MALNPSNSSNLDQLALRWLNDGNYPAVFTGTQSRDSVVLSEVSYAPILTKQHAK